MVSKTENTYLKKETSQSGTLKLQNFQRATIAELRYRQKNLEEHQIKQEETITIKRSLSIP